MKCQRYFDDNELMKIKFSLKAEFIEGRPFSERRRNLQIQIGEIANSKDTPLMIKSECAQIDERNAYYFGEFEFLTSTL